jgi:hypothetical protein
MQGLLISRTGQAPLPDFDIEAGLCHDWRG